MDRHMRGVCNQVPGTIKKCAGEIQSLFDIDRLRRVLQSIAHLLSDRHKQVVKNFQHHWVSFGANNPLRNSGFYPIQDEIALG